MARLFAIDCSGNINPKAVENSLRTIKLLNPTADDVICSFSTLTSGHVSGDRLDDFKYIIGGGTMLKPILDDAKKRNLKPVIFCDMFFMDGMAQLDNVAEFELYMISNEFEVVSYPLAGYISY